MNPCQNQHAVRFQLCKRHHVTCERSRSPCMQKSLENVCSEKSLSLGSDSRSQTCKPVIEKLKIIPGFPEPYKRNKIKKKKEKSKKDTANEDDGNADNDDIKENLFVKKRYEPLYEDVQMEDNMYGVNTLDLSVYTSETTCTVQPICTCTSQNYTPDTEQAFDTQTYTTAEEEHVLCTKQIINELECYNLPEETLLGKKNQLEAQKNNLDKCGETRKSIIKKNVGYVCQSTEKKKPVGGKRDTVKKSAKHSIKKSKKEMKERGKKRKSKMMLSFNEDYYEHRGCPGGYRLYNVSLRQNNR